MYIAIYYDMIGIYKITNTKTGMFYIGSSKHIKRRFWEHESKLRNNSHGNYKLQNSWNKHGDDTFEFEVLEETHIDDLLTAEQRYLDDLRPYERNVGYNISETVNGADNFTNHPNKEEIRKTLSGINAGNKNPMHGKKHKESSIKLQKERSVGRYTLDWFIERDGEVEGKAKYDARNVALKSRDIRHSYDNGMKGKKRGPLSDEAKKRISDAKKRMLTIKDDLIADIKTHTFTLKQLAERYEVSLPTAKRYRRLHG
jgi:group I intron endonuclease